MSSDEKPPKLDPATQKAWDYLVEVIGDYEAFLSQIGELGFSAPQVLYYRDEVQEFLEELKDHPLANYQGAWNKVKELDKILRKKAQELVNEIGHKNFIQYQIINDPPKKHWWWWLNRVTSAPPPPPKVWEFWKYESSQKPKPEETPEPAKPEELEIPHTFTLEDVAKFRAEDESEEDKGGEKP